MNVLPYPASGVRRGEAPSLTTDAIRAILAVTWAVAMMLLLDLRVVGPPTVLAIVSASLVVYLTIEVLALRRSLPPGTAWLLSPVVVASVYVLGFSFGAANLLFWLPGYADSLPASRALDYRWLATTALYALIGAAAMWTGFRSGAGQSLGRMLWRSVTLQRLMRPGYNVRWGVVWVCVGLSFASRLTQFALGMYGVLGDAGLAGQAYRQWLNYPARAGLIALLAVAAAAFSNQTAGRKWLLGFLVLYEMAWGVLAADKTNTILPLVVVGLVYYYTTRQLPWRYVSLAVLALVFSFLVLMPLRGGLTGVDVRDVKQVASAAADVATAELLTNTPDEANTSSLLYVVLQRLNKTRTASYGLRYRAMHPEDPIPKTFAETTLLTPLYTFVPRAIWPSKPRRQVVGFWYYQTVLEGKSMTTLAGPTFIGYLNFAGGLMAVILGFLLVGVLQRGVHERFLLAAGGGGLVLLMGLLSVLGDLPTQYSEVTALPFRLFPLLIAAQWILFQPPPPAARPL